MSEEKPKRSILGLSLRVMLGLVLMTGLALGWWASTIRDQREAVAAIRAAGGTVTYDWEASPDHKKKTPKGPRWLREWLGPDAFDTADRVILADRRCDDALMKQVIRLTRLERLEIMGGSAVTEAGLDAVRQLPHLKDLTYQRRGPIGTLAFLEHLHDLRWLALTGSAPKDAQMRYLAGMPNLEWLSFDGSQLTDAGLRPLRGLTRLKTLHLIDGASMKGSGITGKGLESVSALPNLTSLRLRMADGPAEPSDLAALGRATSMKYFSLDHYPVGDGAAAALRDLKQIDQIHLNDSRFSDAGLAEFGELTSLTWLDVSGEKITGSGIEGLGRLPGLTTLYLSRANLRRLDGLAKCRALTGLQLISCRIDPAEVRHIAGLSGLWSLALFGPDVDDAVVAQVAGLNGLRRLTLGGGAITDASIPALVALPALTELYLRDVEVTDAGLAKLGVMKGLRTLLVYSPKTTVAGAVVLKRALPRVRVTVRQAAPRPIDRPPAVQ